MAFRLAFRFRLAAANCAIIAAIVLIHLSPQILKIGQDYFFWIWFQVFVCQHVYVSYSPWESVLYRARKNSSRPFSARLHFLLRVAFVNKSQTAFSRIVNRVIQHIFGKSTYNKNETLENNAWRLWLKLCRSPNLKRYPDYKAEPPPKPHSTPSPYLITTTPLPRPFTPF